MLRSLVTVVALVLIFSLARARTTDDPLTCKLLVTISDTGDFRSLAFSPDGKRLAIGGVGSSRFEGRQVGIYDVTTGERCLMLEGHTDFIRCAAFTPDGKCLLSASQDRTLKIWDAAHGTELRTLTGTASRGSISPSVRMRSGSPTAGPATRSSSGT